MSAQQQNWFNRVIDSAVSFFLLKPHLPEPTNWQRSTPIQEEPVHQETPPAVPAYPVFPVKPYRQGDTARAYAKTHPTGPMKPVTTSLRQLPPEKLAEIVAKAPPHTIAPARLEDIPTVRQLNTTMLPQHVHDHIPTASGKLPNLPRPLRSQPLRPLLEEEASPAPVFFGDPQSPYQSSPLHGNWRAEESDNWLNSQTVKSAPVIPGRAEILGVTEQDCEADLSEGDEPTMTVPKEVRNTPSLWKLLPKTNGK